MVRRGAHPSYSTEAGWSGAIVSMVAMRWGRGNVRPIASRTRSLGISRAGACRKPAESQRSDSCSTISRGNGVGVPPKLTTQRKLFVALTACYALLPAGFL